MRRDALQDLLPGVAERDAAQPDAYPAETVRLLYEHGLVGAPLPAELGGSDWTLADAVQLIETLGRYSGSAALIASMPLGLAGVIAATDAVVPADHRARWAAQREKLAADFRAGKLYAACNSEKGVGGSLEPTKALARRDGDRFLVTGEKILASSGQFATYFFSTAKAAPEELPGTGVVEVFLVSSTAPGVQILGDWDGFGMRGTESQSVRYQDAPADDYLGFPGFMETVEPLPYWYCLFAAIPLASAGALLQALGTPAPASPALRLRLSEALMRYEALRAYLLETATAWRPGSPPAYRSRVLRTKTYVTQEATRLTAELFALGGGRHYRRTDVLARALADGFAGTALRPPLPLGLDLLVDNFELDTAQQWAAEMQEPNLR